MQTFSKPEKNLLMLPVPCLAVGYLNRADSDEKYNERAELIGYVGEDAVVKARTTKNLSALLRMLGALG